MKVKGLNEKLGNKFVFDAFVIDEKTGINFPIKIQEGIQFVQVGPFPAIRDGKLDKTFRLFFYNSED